jgi:CDP-glucose 4,6-dehydratase
MGIRKSRVEVVELMTVQKKIIDSYRNKTVLITGHTGFKGSWLALWLDSMGAEVVGLSLDPPTNPSFFEVTNLSERITDIRGDILDQQRVRDTIREYRPDYIFHLAAQPIVRDSYENPLETFNVNIMGTAILLESIRKLQNPTICVCITSDKCYENREWPYAYRETDRLGGHDPYSASKGAAEIVIASYRNSFFNTTSGTSPCTVSSARAGNIIGGGDWAKDRIVPDCVKALSGKKRIIIRNPGATRPWQFVLEPLYGYLLLACSMKENPALFAEAWNFGPLYTSTIDVQGLTEKIIHVWGSGTWKGVSQTEKTPHEANCLRLDIAKSVARLGWKPVYSIDEAVQQTIDWYKHYYSGEMDMYAFSLTQIAGYLKKANKSSK